MHDLEFKGKNCSILYGLRVREGIRCQFLLKGLVLLINITCFMIDLFLN